MKGVGVRSRCILNRIPILFVPYCNFFDLVFYMHFITIIIKCKDCWIQGFEVSWKLNRNGENLLAGGSIWHEWDDVWMQGGTSPARLAWQAMVGIFLWSHYQKFVEFLHWAIFQTHTCKKLASHYFLSIVVEANCWSYRGHWGNLMNLTARGHWGHWGNQLLSEAIEVIWWTWQ